MITQYIEDSKKKWTLVIMSLVGILIFCFCLNVSFGSVSVGFTDVLGFLFGEEQSRKVSNILINFRFPKAITAILVGAGLGISGLQMQTLFRNALAGPYILGISSGAGLGAALAIFLGFHMGGLMEFTGLGRSWLMVVSSGLGAFFVLGLMVLVSSRLRDSVTLLIVGLMFGAVSGALVSILQFFSQAQNIQAYVMWSFGSLGSLSWVELSLFVPIVLTGLILAIALSKPLNALLLGEQYASSLGLNLGRMRLLIILNTSLLAGTITAFCGPIAFVGIALPHLARMLFNTTDHLRLTPIIILFGGVLMLVFDLIAQLPGTASVLPINAVTALFGGPFVIFLMLRKRSINYTYSR